MFRFLHLPAACHAQSHKEGTGTSLCLHRHVQVLAPQQRVLFLDTDSMPAPEVRAGDTLSNPGEAAIMTDIVKALDLGKVPLQDIGIISPYRAQVGTHA